LKGLLQGFWYPFRLLKSVKYSWSYGLNEVYNRVRLTVVAVVAGGDGLAINPLRYPISP